MLCLASVGLPGLNNFVSEMLMMAGLLTRPIAILFVIEMLVAMASTKIPLFLGTYPLALPPVPPQVGFWAVLHEIRSEYAQLACSLFVLLVGPGAWSLDYAFRGRKEKGEIHRLVAQPYKPAAI